MNDVRKISIQARLATAETHQDLGTLAGAATRKTRVLETTVEEKDR